VSALIYQVLWTRVLGWTFGVTIYAASVVWASFMAGLAIGSLAAGRVGDRVARPLRWFGATEILVGTTALATPAVLEWMQREYVSLYPSLPHSTTGLTLVRLVMAFSVLIVPTALMGATLPLVIKSSLFADRRLDCRHDRGRPAAHPRIRHPRDVLRRGGPERHGRGDRPSSCEPGFDADRTARRGT